MEISDSPYLAILLKHFLYRVGMGHAAESCDALFELEWTIVFSLHCDNLH
jgi:hypothetical protein